MPVTVNGSVLTQTDVTSPSPSTLTFTSTVLTAGDIVVITVAENSPSTFGTASAPTGGTGLSWTQIILQQNTASHFSEAWAYWTKVPSDQTSTITVTTTNTSDVGTAAALYRLSGVDQVTPIGLTDGFQGQTDPTGTDLQLSGTKAGSLIIAAASDWSAGTASLTISISNTTSAATDLNNLESAQFRALSNHGSQSGSTNQGTYDYSAATGDWAAIIFEVQAAPAAGGLLFRPGKTWKHRYKHSQRLMPGAVASPDVTVNAENAAFTILGQDAAVDIQVNADCATWTFTANDATATVAPAAENAPWTLAGQDAVAALGVNAGNAAWTLAAQDAVTALGVNAEFAPINLLANDAVAEVSGSVNAPAECATWTLAAQDAAASVTPNAELAQITLTTNDASVGIGVPADLAILLFTAGAVATAPPLVAYVEVIGGTTAGSTGAGSVSGTLEAGSVGIGASGSSTGGQVEGTTTPAGLPS